ncbi:hypothetical protein GH741_01075 [Aquibacillus halophilus]|uniref:Uncharacterized protein n=1 Tax=Aquibacillus halophilus TaxID=930132 RepID=A0A6A8DIY1_9BACI|nr:hypothetical protein [Aquibacillus halophilus]MRH41262.1 hypothetical protein [Aquibacillus halophilus]
MKTGETILDLQATPSSIQVGAKKVFTETDLSLINHQFYNLIFRVLKSKTRATTRTMPF